MSCSVAPASPFLKTGADRVASDPTLLAGFGRIGVVSNQSTTSSTYKPVAEVVADACHALASAANPPRLVAVFGPQHGYFQCEQDNMIETPDTEFVYMASYGTVRVPLMSLYKHASRAPGHTQLANIDTLIVDLPDVGCRVYTYLMTLAYCLQSANECKDHPVRVVVLDRPNPIGLCHRHASDSTQWLGIEGNLLNPAEARSFSGEKYRLPYRHGLTMGELGRLFAESDHMTLDYQVITVEGLRRDTPLDVLSKQPFVLPSPNMPSWSCAYIYPAMVFYEATNMSEGRGTCRPFEIVGAPKLDVDAVMRDFYAAQKDPAAQARWGNLEGITLRHHHFRPTFSKHAGHTCQGFQIHFDPAHPSVNTNMFAVGLRLVQIIGRHHNLQTGATTPDRFTFQWRAPSDGYEFNTTEYAISLQCGSTRYRPILENGNVEQLDTLLQQAQTEANTFAEQWKHIFLYQ
ncbi:putative SSS sodium solute transporter [Paratrimastix pyriformis]|uniref:SSS sodium solute transporter n=1 Tax=Paratrimastix pyriformis TaxID=342808 RepID=A0ABQ8UI54_9EUKA|nr:putative SSS sodium solute transporter [Paratrimastix pyriformis]